MYKNLRNMKEKLEKSFPNYKTGNLSDKLKQLTDLQKVK